MAHSCSVEVLPIASSWPSPLIALTLLSCLPVLLRPKNKMNISNPWSLPTPLTPTPFTPWTSPTTLISMPNRLCPPPLIPYLLVFLITHLAREHHLQTHKVHLQNSPHL